MNIDPGPFVLTVIRTGSKQRPQTYEVTTVGLALDGALQYVVEGQPHSIPSGSWKSFEVSRPGFRFKHMPGDAPAREKPGVQSKH